MSTKVDFINITKSYNRNTILSDFSLGVDENEFLTILGKHGRGKSVILRILLGLETFDEGKLFINGKDGSTITTGDRGIGYVQQSFALFPNLS